MILLYRSPNLSATFFPDMINQLLTLSTVHLVLGGFNIDGMMLKNVQGSIMCYTIMK